MRVPAHDLVQIRRAHQGPALAVSGASEAVELAGVAAALPGDDLPGGAVDNAALAGLVDAAAARLRAAGHERDVPACDPDFPRTRIGIVERRVLDVRLGVRDLAAAAARKALTRAGIHPEAVVAVVVSTVSSRRRFPAVAAHVHAGLGLRRSALALDTGMGCNGFLLAWDVAVQALMDHPPGSAALVVAAEALTRLCDLTDRETVPIFGDGAGAAVLVRGTGTHRHCVHAWTQGDDGARIQHEPGNEADDEPRLRLVHRDGRPVVALDADSRARIRLDGRRVFRDMVRTLPSFVREALAAEGRTLEDVDRFAFHQANQRMLEAITGPAGLDLAPERVLSNIAHVGNTASASIPILLAHAEQKGELRPGERVLLVGFGTGYSLGATTVRWS